jgi:CubicO group peptidase (beta-lactamase class C family)
MKVAIPIFVLAAFAASAPASSRAELSPARVAAAALPRLHSLIVSQRGAVALEYYARGFSATRPANIKSASKSIITALVGIAIERRLIRGVDEPIVRWFPELLKEADERKRTITVEDLLTMRSGLESTSGENYGRWVSSRDWVRYALARPMVSDPGTSMEYSTGTSHVLSALLTRALRMSTHQFAEHALARPIGISLAPWPRDPQGVYFGGNEMLMTPRQMVAFGELYLNRGRARGVQVVPEAWIDASCRAVTRSRWDNDREYGYGWWTQEFAGERACFAWGFGGQYIMVFRDLDLVVAVTSSTAVSDERRGYRRQLFDLLETHILAPIVSEANASTRSGRSARRVQVPRRSRT